MRPQFPLPMVSGKPRSTPRRNAAIRETDTMATASQRNKRVVLARFPAPPLGIVKAGMRRNLVAVALPSQSDSAKHGHGGKLSLVRMDDNPKLYPSPPSWSATAIMAGITRYQGQVVSFAEIEFVSALSEGP